MRTNISNNYTTEKKKCHVTSQATFHRVFSVHGLHRKAFNYIRGAWVGMEYLNTTLTISIGETYSVRNVVGRGTPIHISRTKNIKPISISTKPFVIVRRI